MIKVAIIGMGNRGRMYADYSLEAPDKMQVVQIVDVNSDALAHAGKLYHVPESGWYHSVEEFLNAPKIADAVINCSMDQYHFDTTMPLFKLGYDVLLEKPISPKMEELNALRDESKKYNCKFLVCHVLRYTPFYVKAKEILLSGEIGQLESIEMAEHVYIPHMLASYVRGKWKSEKECGSPMIMAKCCHDTDLMTWFNEGANPTFISSFGARSVFTKDRKPEGASDKCLTCKYMKECQYSCYWNVKNNGMDSIIFQNAVEGKQWYEITEEDKEKVFLEDKYLGKCVFDEPYDIVDHQTTSVLFENGVTATLNMIGGTSYPCRTLHITCTSGEIYGVLEENKIYERIYQKDKFYRETKEFNLGDVGIGHSGGDMRLIADFINYLITGEKSISQTNIDSSIDGHLIAIAADISDKQHKTVIFKKDRTLNIN